MLGSNLSADSVASTDSKKGMRRHLLFRPSAASPASGEASSDKSWGCGGKAPANSAGLKCPSTSGDLS
jgi:hypothetical protein